jgi:hypothetical protein
MDNVPIIIVPVSEDYYYKIQIGKNYEIKESVEKVIDYLNGKRYNKVIIGKMGTKTLSEKLSQNKIEFFYN